jgi:hypothetical protein
LVKPLAITWKLIGVELEYIAIVPISLRATLFVYAALHVVASAAGGFLLRN